MSGKQLLGGITVISALLLAGMLYLKEQLGTPYLYEADTDLEITGIKCSGDTASRLAVTLHRGQFSRPDLRMIARMTDLDLRAENSLELGKLLEDLEDNIKIDFTDPCTSSNDPHAPLFTKISYIDPDPDAAKSVIQASLTTLVEEISERDEDRLIKEKNVIGELYYQLGSENNDEVRSALAEKITEIKTSQARNSENPLRFHILNPPEVGYSPINKHSWAIRVFEGVAAKNEAAARLNEASQREPR